MTTLPDPLEQARRIGGRLRSELTSIYKIGGLPCFAAYLGKLAAKAPEVVRKKSLAPADREMRGSRYRFSVEGQAVLLDGGTIGLVREIYGRRCYFSAPGFSIQPSDVVVDLGAQVGVFTVLAAKMARRVVAVEAQLGFIDELRENLRVNGCLEKVAAVHGLIGGSRGVLSDEARLVSASHYWGVRPPSIAMNELIREHGLTAIHFLKMDIEGSEFDVLLRDNEWLSIVERIAMEVHCDHGPVDDLMDTLRARGYRVCLFDEESAPAERLTGRSGFLFARREGPSAPVVAS
jgi:FkbM family methyltransferase